MWMIPQNHLLPEGKFLHGRPGTNPAPSAPPKPGRTTVDAPGRLPGTAAARRPMTATQKRRVGRPRPPTPSPQGKGLVLVGRPLAPVSVGLVSSGASAPAPPTAQSKSHVLVRGLSPRRALDDAAPDVTNGKRIASRSSASAAILHRRCGLPRVGYRRKARGSKTPGT